MKPEEYFSLKDLQEYLKRFGVACSRSSLYQKEKEGLIPKFKRLPGRKKESWHIRLTLEEMEEIRDALRPR